MINSLLQSVWIPINYCVVRLCCGVVYYWTSAALLRVAFCSSTRPCSIQILRDVNSSFLVYWSCFCGCLPAWCRWKQGTFRRLILWSKVLNKCRDCIILLHSLLVKVIFTYLLILWYASLKIILKLIPEAVKYVVKFRKNLVLKIYTKIQI